MTRTARMRLRNVGTVIWLIGCSSCDGYGSSELTSIVRRDSMGVEIVETPASLADRTAGWTIDPNPEIEIGRAEARPGNLALFGIAGVRSFMNGNIMIVERSGRVSLVSGTGRRLRTTGGRGAGPGEYRARPAMLASLDSIGVMVHDPGLRRISVLTADGGLQETISLPSVIRSRPVANFGRLLLLKRHPGTMDATPGLHASAVFATYAIYDLEQARLDTVTVLQHQQWFTDVDRRTGSRAMFPVPFDVPTHEAPGPHGFFLLPGEVASGSIYHYGLDGALVRILRTGGPASPPSDALLDEYIERRQQVETHPNVRLLFGHIYEGVELPEAVPVFDRVLADQHGRVWARRWEPPGSGLTWTVFDQTGGAIGSVAMPKGMEPLQIGRDFVLGVWRDSLGVEYVRRHRIRGGGGQ